MLKPDQLARGDSLRMISADKRPLASSVLQFLTADLFQWPSYEEYAARERVLSRRAIEGLRGRAFAPFVNRG